MMLETFTPVATTEPGLDVTLYVTPAAPAVPAAPCVKVMVAWAFPPVAVPIVGTAGLVPGVIELDADDAADVTPLLEILVTVKVTAVPAVVVIAIGELSPVAV
jgi:hypothetical protein